MVKDRIPLMFPKIQFYIHTNSISGVLNLAYSKQKSTKQCGYLTIGVVLLRARSEKMVKDQSLYSS
jgi:hypothetical protein